jgi:heme oxygenase
VRQTAQRSKRYSLADLRERLRAETADLHEQLEALPFFRALHAGRLPKIAIISYLRGLAILHAILERELPRVSLSVIAKLGAISSPKTSLLTADLDMLGAESMPSVTSAIQVALEYGAEILADADEPLTLAGVLYVLEGSQNGGIVLKQAYANCLGLPENQLSYFGCYGRTTAAHWKSFGVALNACGSEDGQAEKIVLSAIRCFERLHAFCQALFPYAETGLKHHVTTINFEAGDHAMPQDPREIGLALRAGRIAWLKFPYLESRFGERGRRFTSSDSCWLVALTHMPVETASKNLEWLRTVLASRGIPTIVLEGHLRAILRAFADEFPECADMPAQFAPFLSKLEAERKALAGAENLPTLIEQCDRRLRACVGVTVNSAAQLIASAWVDERSGISGALAATRDWFTDAERFSKGWITAVHDLVTALEHASGRSC